MINIILNALKIIFLLGFLVFIHEGGHFLIAKLSNVMVKEFAIGFGPTIWKKQGKETKYALRLIPLGGFVNLEGENELSDSERSFSNASVLKRIAIVSAGAIVNIVFALIIYFLLFAIIGNNYSTIVDYAIPGYNAEIAGITTNDEIIRVNNKRVRMPSDINEIINEYGDEEIELLIKRNNEYIKILVKPTKIVEDTSDIYFLGIQFKYKESSFFNNMYYAGLHTRDFIKSIANGLKDLFSTKTENAQVMGPVGISNTISKTENIAEYIYLMSVISISLGVTNLLPFPPLDGGKIVFLILEAIRKKPVKQELEIQIQLIGFAILMTISMYVAYQDIIKIL